jgi:hypothetical protein
MQSMIRLEIGKAGYPEGTVEVSLRSVMMPHRWSKMWIPKDQYDNSINKLQRLVITALMLIAERLAESCGDNFNTVELEKAANESYKRFVDQIERAQHGV